jgi:hypothetical protein
MIGKPYSGKPNVRFDEGELEIEHSATTPALYSTVRDKSDFRKILYFLLLKTEHSAILPGMRHSDSNPQ